MKLIASKNVSGIHSLTGKTLNYLVEAFFNPESPDLQGRWSVAINGKVCRWYAMESPAVRRVRQAKVGAYGITIGESF